MKYLLFIPIAFFLFSCEDKYERPLALDCAGVSGGTAEMQTYCLDSDNDGLGGNYCSNICDAFVEEGWVNNSSDSDDSYLHDNSKAERDRDYYDKTESTRPEDLTLSCRRDRGG